MLRLCLATVALVTLAALPASAQGLQCAPRERVLNMLSAQDQTRRAMGLAGQAVMELYAANDGSRWTMTVTLPDGRMCLLANGIAFEARNDGFPLPGTPS